MSKKNKSNNLSRGIPIDKPSNEELEKIANSLGFVKFKFKTRNKQIIFWNKRKRLFISFDIGSGTGSHHKNGFWKMAKKDYENLNSKKTRMGTYDINLNRVGD